MNPIVKIIKKTPLNVVWKAAKHSSWGKEWRKKRKIAEEDRVYYQMLPDAYISQAEEPLQENKVIMIEPRYASLSNTFQVLYQALTQQYRFDVHIHCLRDTYVPREEYLKNCEQMLRDAATAKYIFLSEASRVVSCVPMRKETIVTQLWHGCGAFKKFGLSTAELIFGPNSESLERHPFHRHYSHVTVSSPEVIWAYAEAMGLEDQKELIKPVGVSRTDVYFQKERIQEAREKLERLMPKAAGRKVILYAPTFRGRVAKATSPDCLDVEAFAKALGEEYVLLFKHHPLVKQRPEIPEETRDVFAMDMTEEMTIEELLLISDICISDYSSLIFEYSLLERPMIFYAYDLDEYFDWRGFYYDYDDLTPGPIFKENAPMIAYIQQIGERFDRQQVVDFRNKFMSACDGHATERIMEMVFGEDLKKYATEEKDVCLEQEKKD